MLRFCIIDLRNNILLNARTVKDAYALVSRIEETLDYLAGSNRVSVLCFGFKVPFKGLEIWQVELDEESKPKLTVKDAYAFTAGPLGFYECEQGCHLGLQMPQPHSRE